MKNKKQEFIYNELWILTVMGGFQRANIYKKGIYLSEEKRREFRKLLQEKIHTITITDYKVTVTTNKHIENINTIISISSNKTFSKFLNNGKISFGVAQKLLNLYLKYFWCNGEKIFPPHFPVDRIIQERLNKMTTVLNKRNKKKLYKRREIISWTQMESKDIYGNNKFC